MEVEAEKEGAEQFVDAMRMRASAEDAKMGIPRAGTGGRTRKKAKEKA